jgi:hypothetical protein
MNEYASCLLSKCMVIHKAEEEAMKQRLSSFNYRATTMRR